MYLDFVVEQAGRVLPIEVKSGKDYEKHSALDNVMAVPEYGIQESYVFTNDNIKTDGKLTYLPIYMVMFLQDEPIGFIDISVDKFKLWSVGTGKYKERTKFSAWELPRKFSRPENWTAM